MRRLRPLVGLLLVASLAIAQSVTMSGKLTSTGNTIQSRPTLVILTNSLLNATKSALYNQTVLGSGGKSPYAWSVTVGSLPAGLTLSSSTGTISGTPSAVGNSIFTVTLTDANSQTASKSLSLTVDDVLSISTTSLQGAVTGTSYSQALAVSGGLAPYSLSLASGTLPTGLTLDNSGVLSGTPTAAGVSNFVVAVTDSTAPLNTATQALSITVTNPVTSFDVGFDFRSTGALVADPNFATDVECSAYPVTRTVNGFAVTFGWESGISNCLSNDLFAGGDARLAGVNRVLNNGGQATFRVDLPSAAVYNLSLAGGNFNNGANESLVLEDSNAVFGPTISNLAVPAGSFLDANATIWGASAWPASNTTLNRTFASSIFRLIAGSSVASTSESSIAHLRLTLASGGGLGITTSSLLNATQTVAYSQTLAAVGGTVPYSWAVTVGTLPAGLTLHAGTGVIDGTPNTVGSSSFTVQVTDNVAASASQALSIVVGALPTPTITTSSPLPAGTQNQPYSTTFAATGGTPAYTAWAVTAGALPAGLTLVSATGTLTGTPTGSGTFSFTVRVTDSASQTASGVFSLSINAASNPLSITTASLPSGLTNVSYSATVSATGGVQPYAWTILSGTLCTGLGLTASTGGISGVPNVVQTCNFTVQVTDAASTTKQQALSIAISAATVGSAGATATQYILTYTASNSAQCSVEVSTSNTYAPLVPAVDASKFLNSNLDGQSTAGSRALVLGQRTVLTENAAPPSISVAAGNAARASLTVRGTNPPLIYGQVTVSYPGHPFVPGDNIVVSAMTNALYNTARGRVMTKLDANHFTYFVTDHSASDTSGGGTITRANRYSLALENTTQHFVRIGQTSNCGATASSLTGSACSAGVCTGTFNTMNWPNGDTWAENTPLDSAGVVIFPTLLENQSAAYSITDPMTGTRNKPMGIFADDYSGISISGGAGSHCSLTADSNNFHHCYLAPNGASMFYGVNESTGEVRYLGFLSFTTSVGECGIASPPHVDNTVGNAFDPTDANALYGTCTTSSGGHTDVFKAVYTGNDVAVSSPGTGVHAAFTLNVLTPSSLSKSFDQLLVAFDAAFNPSQFKSCSLLYVSGTYAALQCPRWNQGAPTWGIMFNIGDALPIDATCGGARLNCPRIVAAGASWGPGLGATCGAPVGNVYCTGLYPFRWTGYHSMGDWDGPQSNWTSRSSSYLNFANQATMGPFEIQYTGAGLNNTDASDTIAVTSTPPAACNNYGAGVAGDPISASCPPDGSPFLDQALPGDFISWEDTGAETDQITARNSATSLTIARGCHWNSAIPPALLCDKTGEVVHATNAKFFMYSRQNLPPLTASAHAWWDFVHDPHGTDQTNTYMLPAAGFNPGHWAGTRPYLITEGWGAKNNATWDHSFFQSIEDFAIITTPPFAGIKNQCGGSSCNMYPKYLPADSSAQTWFWESSAYTGGAYTDPVATLVSRGPNYVIEQYQFLAGNPFDSTYPYFSVSGKNTRLVDISGPGSVLPASAAGNNQYCIAHASNECIPGSLTGNAYANFPDPAGTFISTPCRATETGIINNVDWCLNNQFSMIGGIEQVSFQNAQIGTGTDGKPIQGASKSRKLVQGLIAHRLYYSTGNNMLPDDGWVLYSDCMSDPYLYSGSVETTLTCLTEVLLAKIPPQPPLDGIDRTNYETVTVAIGPGSGGATHARVKYGYAENESVHGASWPPSIHFYCTQYKGACYSASQTIALNGTYNLVAGVPQRVMFYQVEYLDGSNTLVASDPMTAVAVP